MRGAIAAEQLVCMDAYTDAVYTAVWVDGKNMGDAQVFADTLLAAGLDSNELLNRCQDTAVKAALVAATEEAVERGCFGAPTLFMDGQMYFGQDRLDFIEEALQPRT
jgi:2-hydroxychromene-2-carboxylate isomerase